MNKVMMKVKPAVTLSQLRGSIWEQKGTNGAELYILAQVSVDEFCLVSLKNGNRLNDPSSDINEVTLHAFLVAEESMITVEAL